MNLNCQHRKVNFNIIFISNQYKLSYTFNNCFEFRLFKKKKVEEEEDVSESLDNPSSSKTINIGEYKSK